MTSYIGTSGFYYKDWRGNFYPEDLPKREWLQYYAKLFRTVEINNTFYQTPKRSVFEKWDEDTPHNFKFTVKGNRYITHLRKLNEPEESLKKFYNSIEPLGHKIVCVLWQLPPNFHFNREKLIHFAESCSHDYANVMEFRHASWFTEECYAILKKYKMSFCMLSTADELPEMALKTSRTAYLRFHGKDKSQRYRYDYSAGELRQWVDKIKQLNPLRIFIYFNNDYQAHAIGNGLKMQEMLA